MHMSVAHAGSTDRVRLKGPEWPGSTRFVAHNPCRMADCLCHRSMLICYVPAQPREQCMNTLAQTAAGESLVEGSFWTSIKPLTASFHEYLVYGASLRSEIMLALPESCHGSVDIELATAESAFFFAATAGMPLERNRLCPFDYAHLPDGSSYVRWEGLGEFLVSPDGRRIACRRFDGAETESFQVYLLGQALSFALVKKGLEPLHATCVVVDGEVVVLLGDSGFGKSSLAACFLHGGHRLLTDDLLIVRESPAGLLAYPGPPRIKLLPAMARRFLGPEATGIPMNPRTRKLVIPLDDDKVCSTPAPIRAVYALVAPHAIAEGAGIRIAPLSSREAFVTLLNNTFNYVLVSADRLRRQFCETTALVHNLEVRSLAYPRKVAALPSVRDAIIDDFTLRQAPVPACVD